MSAAGVRWRSHLWRISKILAFPACPERLRDAISTIMDRSVRDDGDLVAAEGRAMRRILHEDAYKRYGQPAPNES